jgi:hypothetical protein
MRVDIEKIEDLLPGLATYQQPDEKTVKAHIRDSNPIIPKNNIIFLVLYIFCFLANLIVALKQLNAGEVYVLLKQVQMYTFATPEANYQHGIPMKTSKPTNRNELL